MHIEEKTENNKQKIVLVYLVSYTAAVCVVTQRFSVLSRTFVTHKCNSLRDDKNFGSPGDYSSPGHPYF